MFTRNKEWYGLSFLKIVIITLILLIAAPQSAKAEQDPIIQLTELTITGKKYTGLGRWPLISDLTTPKQLNYGLDLTLNTNLLLFFYWNNNVVTMVDQTQFRAISYKFEVGIRILPCLYVEYGHTSQHVFDAVYPPGYPVIDYIGFKINIVNPSKEKTLFWYFDKD